MKKDFNDFRFDGLSYSSCSNNYFQMNRVNDDETKIVVRVSDAHLIETKYGYALILDRTHVVFLKKWQVSENYFGNEILITKEYFNVKEWGVHDEFDESDEYQSWEKWVEVAKEQDAKNEDGMKNCPVKWEK